MLVISLQHGRARAATSGFTLEQLHRRDQRPALPRGRLDHGPDRDDRDARPARDRDPDRLRARLQGGQAGELPLLLFLVLADELNPMVRIYAWRMLLGREGLINEGLQRIGLIDQPIDALLFSKFAVIVVLSTSYLTYTVIPIYGAMKAIDKNLFEAARDLGAGWWTTTRRVLLPLIAPGIFVSLLLVYIPLFTDFASPTLVGGTSGYMLGQVVNDLVLESRRPQRRRRDEPVDAGRVGDLRARRLQAGEDPPARDVSARPTALRRRDRRRRATTASSPPSTSPGPACSTVVLERREIVGGCCVTEEFAPGFRASTGAYVLSMLREPVWRDLQPGRARDRGRPGRALAQPVRRRLARCCSTTTSPTTQDEMRALLGRRRPRRCPSSRPSSAEIADLITPLIDTTPPEPRRHQRPVSCAGSAGSACAPPATASRISDALFLFGTSATQYLSEFFGDDQVLRGARLARDQRLDRRPLDPGHRVRPAPRPRRRAGRRRDPPVGLRPRRDRPGDRGDGRRGPRGRRRRSAPRPRSSGSWSRTAARPGSSSPTASGSAPAGCSRTPTRRRPSSAWSAQELLPERFAAALRAYRCEGTSVKINLAVDRLPQCGRRSTATASSPTTAGSWRSTRRSPRWTRPRPRRAPGARPLDPHIELCIPTVHDPSLAPDGQARGDDRRQLPALHARRGDLGRAPRRGRRPRDREARALLPRPDRTRSSSARCSTPARPRVAARDLGRPRPARRHGLRPALQPAPGARLGRLPDPDRRTSGSAAPAPTPAAGSPGANGRNCAREVIRDGPRPAREAAGPAPVSPLIPPEWDEIEAPSIAVEPPGPRSREMLERIESHRLPRPQPRADPVRARLQARLDRHRRRRQRLPRLRLGLRLGAARRRPRRSCSSPAIEALRAIRQRGQPRARLGAHRASSASACWRSPPASVTRYDIALNGTEAVEIAIKMMRRATGRPMILGFHGSYHGESTTTAALGAEAAEISARAARALVPGFVHVPYPHPYRTPLRDPRPGAAATRPSTTSATTCSSTPSTRARSPGW